MIMEFPDMNPTGKSPRRELQGPRPTPLRIHKDSHKIKKPPLAPPQQPSQLPPRQPIIIYTVSPKIIHTTPSDFMSLVQSLTGSSSSSSNTITTTSLSSSDPFNANNNGDMVSPAARFAAIEKAMTPQAKKVGVQPQSINQHINNYMIGGGGDVSIEAAVADGRVDRPAGVFPGILSPGPAALSPIPANFFSPPSTAEYPTVGSFLHDLSPALHRSFMEGSFVPSPSYFISPRTPSIDLFNNFFDS